MNMRRGRERSKERRPLRMGESISILSAAWDKTLESFFIPLFLSHSSFSPSANPIECSCEMPRIWPLPTSSAPIQLEPTLSPPWSEAAASQLLLLCLCPLCGLFSVTTETPSNTQVRAGHACAPNLQSFPHCLRARAVVLTVVYGAPENLPTP